MKTLLALFSLMTTMLSCQPGEQPTAAPLDLSAKTLTNVSYGSDSLQVMDIHLPAARSTATTPVMVMLHGGGWTTGSKAEFTTYIDSFKTRLPDYALFNVNYRLADRGHHFPAQEEDVKAAVDFIAKQAGYYGVNKNAFVLLGVSAGAHLALLQAYKQPSPTVRAVVDYFGPTDLLAMYQQPWHPLVPLALQMVTGTTPEANPGLYKSSSPVNFVTPQSPPTLILHGGRDEVVDLSQSKALAQKLEKAGVSHELIIYPNDRHGRWYGNTQVNSFDRIETFLRKTVK